ncbi:Putative glycoside hydrolase family 17, glycoside hydrolase superfamily [Septoria linicola]|uniref:Glycoside hydrolase family 17, glycoside hydrolase superfamily n=1 Tax=Septoria linicola TaxID=215465 RepID=A0A9Q9EM26_9PEZI|nr:putative glycoside hydrolase family 17, glycoside hydrolase superfamily [Septoria linicola]USW56386.1 Putative glycoside hydrolase family 17, glycoside hydrolase superfamily [Septoria linicola]
MGFIRGALLLASIFLDICVAQDNRTYQGFNSGNTFTNYDAKFEDDFVQEFSTMQKFTGAGVFNSVRLYTNIQAYTTSDVLSAIPAAIKTNTSILLGIWCSGSNNITNELTALTKAIDEYGEDLANAVLAISVGSEDLYRLSDVGIRQNAGVGAGPKDIVKFIDDTRKAIEGTVLADKPVGYVDTWRSWVNESNAEVIEAVDFLGVDIYPFFENDTTITPGYVNTFDNAVPIFDDRYQKTLNASQGKQVWVTETGWPYKSEGPAWGESVASVENQRDYWRAVGCSELFGQVNTWWYTLRDANPESKQNFAITDAKVENSTFDLSCAAGASNEVVYENSARRAPRSVFGLVRALLRR